MKEINPLTQHDLYFVIHAGLCHMMDNMESLNMHSYLTSLEGLLYLLSDNILKDIRKELIPGLKSHANSHNFQNTIDEIDKELGKRVAGCQ